MHEYGLDPPPRWTKGTLILNGCYLDYLCHNRTKIKMENNHKIGINTTSPFASPPANMKSCSTCKEVKALSQFGKNVFAKDNKRYQCNACRNITKRRYRSTAKGSRVKKLSTIKSKYGLTEEAYLTMFETQNYRCAICPASVKPLSSRTSCVDHCQATGRVRGILCTGCTTGLGIFDADPNRLMHAVTYLLVV